MPKFDIRQQVPTREDAQPGVDTRVMTDKPIGFLDAVGTGIALDTSFGQAAQWIGTKLAADRFERDQLRKKDDYLFGTEFNALYDMADELEGMPLDVLEDVANERSPAQVNRILANYKANQDRREIIEERPGARLLANFADPINLAPIPLAIGKGLWTGMKVAAPLTSSLMVSTETLRHNLDPTSTWQETSLNIGSGILFGELIAGGAGMYKMGTATRMAGSAKAKGSEYLDKMPLWMHPDSVRHAGQKMENAFNKMEYVNEWINKPFGNMVPDRVIKASGLSRQEYEANIRQEGGADYDVWIKSEAPDEFPPTATRYQGVDGEQVVILDSPDGATMMTRQKDGEWEMTAKGKKSELTKEVDPFLTRHVKSFNTPEAHIVSQMKQDDMYPNSPDKAAAPEDYASWREQHKDKVDYDNDGVHVATETQAEIYSKIGVDLANEINMRRKVVADTSASIKQIKKDIRELRAKIKSYKSKSWKTKKTKELTEKQDNLEKLQATEFIAQNRLRETEAHLVNSEKSVDPEDWDIRPTLTGLENAFGSTNQMPWYRLVKTKLRTQAPELAGDFQRVAYELAGSPGLASYGHSAGEGAGASVEAMTRTWIGKYNEVKMEADRIYFEEYAKLGKDPTNLSMKGVDMKQGFDAVANRVKEYTKRGTPVDSKLLTLEEFRSEIGKAMMKSDNHQIPEIAKAARSFRKFIREFEEDGRKHGIFKTQENMQRRFDNNVRRAEEFQSRINAINERLGGKVEVVREYPDLNDVKPYKGMTIVEGTREHPVHGGQSPISIHRNDDGSVRDITLNRALIAKSFQEKWWTSPRTKGITPLADDSFDTVNDWYEFLLEHEAQHLNYPVIKAKQRGYALNEDAINRAAAKKLGIHERLYGKEKAPGLSNHEVNRINKYNDKIDRIEEENLQIEAWLEQSKDASNSPWTAEQGDNAWFHRVWNIQAIEQNTEMLTGILENWYRKNPFVYEGMTRKKLSLKPAELRARAEETIHTIRKEAMFGDSQHIISHGRADALKQWQDYKEKIVKEYEASVQEKGADHFDSEVLKHRTRIIDKRIERIMKSQVDGIGMSNGLIGRRLDIPNELLIDIGAAAGKKGNMEGGVNFIHTNVEHVLFAYTQRTAPVLEMARKYGDFGMNARMEELSLKIDDVIATKSGKEQEALIQEKEELFQAMEDLRDKVLGTYGIPDDPSALTTRTIRLLMAWNTLTAMGRAFLTAINDLGMVVQVNGYKRMFGDLYDYFFSSPAGKTKWKLAAEEVRWAGQALEVQNAIRSRAIMDLPGDNVAFNGIEKWTYDQQGNFFFLNLLSGWTDMAKRFSGSLIQSKMVKNLLEMEAGTISKVDLEEMGKIGINPEMAETFRRNWVEAGSMRAPGDDGFYLANTANWIDQEAAQQFRAMLGQAVDNIIIMPMAADKPNFMSKDLGRMIMQYHGFSMAATHRIFMSNMQKRDMRALSTVTSMVFLSLLIDQFKRPDYIKLSMEDQLFRAVELSGTLGIVSDLNTSMEQATGGNYGARSLLGLKNNERYSDWGSKIGGVAGAVPNQWLGLAATLTDGDADPKKIARTLRYMVPYNNMWIWNDWVTRTQRTAADTFEE